MSLDCEMVGVGPGGLRSVLALVVVVDWAGRVLLCEHVRPEEPVTDYRTHVSGVRAAHLRGAAPFKDVQRRVAALLAGRILVGHGLRNDFKVRGRERGGERGGEGVGGQGSVTVASSPCTPPPPIRC